MAKKEYFPTTEAGQVEWVGNLAAKLPVYAELLMLEAEEVERIQAGYRYLVYVRDASNQLLQKLREWNSHRDAAKWGERLSAVPAAFQLPPPPTATGPNVLGEARELVKRIKAHPKYTVSIGRDLGVIGAEITDEAVRLQPRLNVTFEGGLPRLKWLRNRSDSTEILVDRGTGAFVPLTITTRSQLIDTGPLPAPGTPAVWRYKAVYRRKDAPVGQWSDVKTVTVIG